MYAIIETQGFQKKVAPGDVVRLQKMNAVGGTAVTFEKVLLVSGEKVLVGNPYVKDARVIAELVRDEKAKKVVIFKKKPRKGHKKTQGHRQQYSLVSIKDIVVGG
jgi:large subunit ribosomal protein L21